MGVHLSGVVAAAATLPALAALTLRRFLPFPAVFVLSHVAVAGFTVSVAATDAMARHSTWIMGKRKDGTINSLSLLIFWPYHLGLRTKLAIQRRVSTEPAWDRIDQTPYYLGAWPSEEALVPAAHVAVLDVTCELPLQVRPPAYKLLPVWDTHSPLPHQIDAGVAWAQQQEREGRDILIHCAHGHGRSATVLCAILISNGKAETVAQAEAMLKRSRPRVRLNRRQRAGIEEWFKLRHKTT